METSFVRWRALQRSRRTSYVFQCMGRCKVSYFNLIISACSLHTTMFRMGGEDSETRFCEMKQVSQPTLTMTWEAKNQLKMILINEVGIMVQVTWNLFENFFSSIRCKTLHVLLQGFPEECLAHQYFSNCGPDNKLDVAISLLCIGLYPNVCMYKEKRKVICESRPALIHKSSVNCPFGNQDCIFPLPFFVFGEKVNLI